MNTKAIKDNCIYVLHRENAHTNEKSIIEELNAFAEHTSNNRFHKRYDYVKALQKHAPKEQQVDKREKQ